MFVFVCSSSVVPCTSRLGVRCGGVCLSCRRARPLLVWLLGCVCVRACAPLAPRPSWGAACGAGVCGCCRGWGFPPPPLWYFLGGGASRRPWVSWSPSPHPLMFGLRLRVCFVVFFSAWCVSACSGSPSSWWAAAPSLVLPVLAGWSSGIPSVGGFGRLLCCGWAFSWLWAFLAPPPLFLFGGGVYLFLPLPSLGWCTHWSAFSAVFRVAVGACFLPGLAPALWVGWVMYMLGSVSLPARLGSCSAGWAVAPGGFLRPCVWGAGVFRVPSPPRCGYSPYGGSLCGRPATVVAWRAVAPCRCVAGWSGSFRGVRWLVLVRPSVSVPCFGVVVCCGAPCCFVPCSALRCGGPCLVAVCPAGSRRVTPCRAVVCCSVPRCVASRRVVACCALGCLVVVRCTVARCGSVCRAASCCAVVGRWRSVWLVSWCRVQVGVWLGGGWGVWLGGVARWVCAVGVWVCRSGWWVG